MNVVTPSDRVVRVLNEAGYSSRPAPLQIRSLVFNFTAILVGPTPLPDLVVIVDTTAEQLERLKAKIEGLARALDFTESRRPLTTVLVGPRPPLGLLESLLRHSRILIVDSSVKIDDSADLRDRLAVLIPIKLPDAGGKVSDPLLELSNALGTEADNKVYRQFIEAAAQGEKQVEAHAESFLAAPLRHRRSGRR